MALLKYATVQKNTSIEGMTLGGGTLATSEGQGKIFKIALNAGDAFSVDKMNLKATNIDVYVYNANGEKVGQSVGSYSGTVSYTPTTAGDYYVHATTSAYYDGADATSRLIFKVGNAAVNSVTEPAQSVFGGQAVGFTQAQIDAALAAREFLIFGGMIYVTLGRVGTFRTEHQFMF